MTDQPYTDPNWLATHIYYCEPFDALITEAVVPLVKAIMTSGWADQYFFIRYWEKGPHLRLRFKGDPAVLEAKVKPKVEADLMAFITAHPTDRTEQEQMVPASSGLEWLPNNSLQYLPYEPEIERYGGDTGILIAEKQFQLSSTAILQIMAEAEGWDYDRALGAAIQLHLGFSHALGMDAKEMMHFYSLVFQGWFPRSYFFNEEMPEEEIIKRKEITMNAFEQNFSQQKEMLVGFFDGLLEAFEAGEEFEQEWLNQWLDGMQGVGAELGQAQASDKLLIREGWFEFKDNIDISKDRQALWIILESYVHMTNNRLGIMNRDEGFLGYLIMESLKALVKQTS